MPKFIAHITVEPGEGGSCAFWDGTYCDNLRSGFLRKTRCTLFDVKLSRVGPNRVPVRHKTCINSEKDAKWGAG